MGFTAVSVFVKELEKACGLTGNFGKLAPLIQKFIEQMEDRRLLATDVSLVKDINVLPNSSGPTGYVSLGNKTIFSADVGGNMGVLFATDGTQNGTERLSNDFSVPGSPAFLERLGSFVYFSGYESGFVNRELWRTDGTVAGTTRVADINPGSGSSNPGNLTVVGSNLYFSATTSESQTELWKYDPSTGLASMVKDIRFGPVSSNPSNLTNVNGVLYFTAEDGTAQGWQLWKSDGTNAGTVRITSDLRGSSQTFITRLTAVGNSLFFSAQDFTNGTELWTANSSGVTMLSINPGGGSSHPASMINVNGLLYFAADNGSTGRELWSSDGTIAGTTRLTDIAAGTGHSLSGSDAAIAALGTDIFFTATNGLTGSELWKWSSITGAEIVRDIRIGSASSIPDAMLTVGSYVYFRADDGLAGNELWRTDGSTVGTTIAADIQTGPLGSQPNYMRNSNGLLYFTATQYIGGGQDKELYVADPATSITRRIEIWGGNNSSLISGLYSNGTKAIFSANDGTTGTEPWVTDGTNNGTLLLNNIFPGSTSSDPSGFLTVGNSTFFAARSMNGRELWKTDGTVAGTSMVMDIRTVGDGNSSPSQFVAVGSTLYFTANDNDHGIELWKTDGTTNGTSIVKDLTLGAGSSSLDLKGSVNGKLFFGFFDTLNVFGGELWVSDGTPTGTTLLKDINTGSASSGVSEIVTVGNKAYFTANDGLLGRELWLSDGTSTGTQIIADMIPGSGSSSPTYLNAVETDLYFVANSSNSGVELWKYDTLLANAPMIIDATNGPGSTNPIPLTEVEGVLFFVGESMASGQELWSTDGTVAGTRIVKDIRPGSASSSISTAKSRRSSVAGIFYFTADVKLLLWHKTNKQKIK